MPSWEVFRHWRLVPLVVEVRARRLALFQQALRDLKWNRHFVAMYFGELRIERLCHATALPSVPPPLDDQGK